MSTRQPSRKRSKNVANHAVLRREAARKLPRDSSGRPKNEAARKKAEEFEKFAADQGEFIGDVEGSAVQLDYEAVAAIVAKGLELAKDQKVWLEFIKLPFWTVKVKKGRPKAKHQPEAIRFMLRRYRGPSEAQSKQASERWRAVKVLLDDKIPPSRIEEALEQRGGYRGINRSKTARHSSAKAAVGHAGPKAVTMSSSTAADPSKSDLPIMLQADFGKHIGTFTSLPTPCKVNIIAKIEKLEKITNIRILKFELRQPAK
ncbi:MAG: hypothetical protein EOR86_17745 [Mesorhizobium sp.]|uniref:hypothetical protein n=1 Tax=Mesorhizobium sp. TaxID=1871066 RepID=UPI000FEA8D23|nr:hypothetical protein [Mesorhizobium sp.]RWM94032.1 MAG: hypothetical protein EOR86_17745 [Mesorhizobium sp.]